MWPPRYRDSDLGAIEPAEASRRCARGLARVPLQLLAHVIVINCFSISFLLGLGAVCCGIQFR